MFRLCHRDVGHRVDATPSGRYSGGPSTLGLSLPRCTSIGRVPTDIRGQTARRSVRDRRFCGAPRSASRPGPAGTGSYTSAVGAGRATRGLRRDLRSAAHRPSRGRGRGPFRPRARSGAAGRGQRALAEDGHPADLVGGGSAGDGRRPPCRRSTGSEASAVEIERGGPVVHGRHARGPGGRRPDGAAASSSSGVDAAGGPRHVGARRGPPRARDARARRPARTRRARTLRRGWSFERVEMPRLDVSSTDLRDRVARQVDPSTS